MDSSAWLEYFADGPNAGAFARAIETPATLLVPTLSLFEVFMRICQQVGEEEGLKKAALMEQGRVVDLDRATARRHKATLWTQDADFSGLEDVRYFART